jgi:hypothetical protein
VSAEPAGHWSVRVEPDASTGESASLVVVAALHGRSVRLTNEHSRDAIGAVVLTWDDYDEKREVGADAGASTDAALTLLRSGLPNY